VIDFDFDALGARVAALAPTCGALRIVAVDGGAASGKSTFALALAAALGRALGGVQILHCDDLLDGWGDQFTFWPRLQAVFEMVRQGEVGSYRRYDWTQQAFNDQVRVQPSGVLIVEGVGAIAACAELAGLRIWLDVPRCDRERRWIARDGAPLQPEWMAWLDAEDQFFAAHPPVADVIISG
jgi:uridine kinase